jgi:AcrR family transcriptional regulator
MPKISASSVVEHREQRRQQLMDAATSLALHDGAHAVTVSAVAQKAGLARSSVYEYFDSSADLIAELIIEEMEYYSNRLDGAVKNITDPFEKIEQWIAEGLRYVADGRHMLVKTLNAISTPENRKDEIARGHIKMMSPLRDAIIATKVRDPRAASTYLQGVIDAASIRIDSGVDAETEIAQATTFALAGLKSML